jgi:hypothetical protein
MKVICIDDSDTYGITFGKVYTLISTNNNPEDYSLPKELHNIFWLSLHITDDNGVNRFYFKSKFISLEEHRETILNNLGI